MRIIKGRLPPSILGKHAQKPDDVVEEVKVKRKCGRPRNPIPRHKRESHINAEHRRRGKIQDCFRTLKALVPKYAQGSGRDSKADILYKVVDKIRLYRQDIGDMSSALDQLRAEKEALNADIKNYQVSVPDLSVPEGLTETSMDDHYTRYVQERTKDTGIFWAFSFIADQLFESYKRAVSGESVSQFLQTVSDWSKDNLCPANLRAVCSTALTQLAQDDNSILGQVSKTAVARGETCDALSKPTPLTPVRDQEVISDHTDSSISGLVPRAQRPVDIFPGALVGQTDGPDSDMGSPNRNLQHQHHHYLQHLHRQHHHHHQSTAVHGQESSPSHPHVNTSKDGGFQNPLDDKHSSQHHQFQHLHSASPFGDWSKPHHYHHATIQHQQNHQQQQQQQQQQEFSSPDTHHGLSTYNPLHDGQKPHCDKQFDTGGFSHLGSKDNDSLSIHKHKERSLSQYRHKKNNFPHPQFLACSPHSYPELRDACFYRPCETLALGRELHYEIRSPHEIPASPPDRSKRFVSKDSPIAASRPRQAKSPSSQCEDSKLSWSFVRQAAETLMELGKFPPLPSHTDRVPSPGDSAYAGSPPHSLNSSGGEDSGSAYQLGLSPQHGRHLLGQRSDRGEDFVYEGSTGLYTPMILTNGDTCGKIEFQDGRRCTDSLDLEPKIHSNYEFNIPTNETFPSKPRATSESSSLLEELLTLPKPPAIPGYRQHCAETAAMAKPPPSSLEVSRPLYLPTNNTCVVKNNQCNPLVRSDKHVREAQDFPNPTRSYVANNFGQHVPNVSVCSEKPYVMTKPDHSGHSNDVHGLTTVSQPLVTPTSVRSPVDLRELTEPTQSPSKEVDNAQSACSPYEHRSNPHDCCFERGHFIRSRSLGLKTPNNGQCGAAVSPSFGNLSFNLTAAPNYFQPSILHN